MNWFVKKLDQNQLLASVLARISTTLAVYRGLPMLVGTGLVIFSLIISAIMIPLLVNGTDVDSLWMLLCIPALLIHLGVIVAMIGVMMAEPLGRGYRE